MARVSLQAMGMSCNSVADALAKKAKSGVCFQVWLEDLPDDIAPFVFRDVH